MRKLIIFLLFWFVSWIFFAQECLVLGESEVDDSYRRNFPQLWNVPVSIKHIVRSDGFSETDQERIYEQVEIFNESSQFVNLVVVEYLEITNDDWWNLDTNNDLNSMRDAHTNHETLNVFVVGRLTWYNSNSSLCGIAYYPTRSTNNRVMFIAGDCVNNNSTFAHEIGHNFDNRHTHNRGDELVNGTNCDTAGDKYCDTPADPRLSTGNVNSDCEYTGTTKDANGDFYNPDTFNMMSYSRKSCRTRFSYEQILAHEASGEFYCETMNCGALNLPKYEIMKINPNPFNDYIELPSNMVYEIYDINGRKVIFGKGDKINTESLSKGFYLLKVSNQVIKTIK